MGGYGPSVLALYTLLYRYPFIFSGIFLFEISISAG
jgi:hypothetical protein